MIALFEKEIEKLQSLKKYYLKRIEALEELIEKLNSDWGGDNILQYDYDGDEKISIIDLTIVSMAALGKLDNDERYDAENLTFNGKPLDLNNDGILNVLDVSTLSAKRSNEASKIGATISTYGNFDVSSYIENYYETNGDFPTLEQLQETYNNYINAPEEIIVDEITYNKTQPENPGEGYELVTTEQNGVTYYAWVELSNVVNGHEYVDLGLPSGTLWAKMNVGATSETDYGNYYKYGAGSEIFDWTTDFYQGRENPLSLDKDTAYQVWGNPWHMPTKEQCEELINNTTYEQLDVNGVTCGKFTAQNGNYIYIPAAGAADSYHNNYHDVGTYGQCWASTPRIDPERPNDYGAYNLYTDWSQGDINVNGITIGYPIRPVCTIETSQI